MKQHHPVAQLNQTTTRKQAKAAGDFAFSPL